MIRKALFTAVAAATITAASVTGAQAAPGPAEEPIYCGPGLVQDGARCVDATPEPSQEQQDAWAAFAFGALAAVYGIGTAIVGV